MAVLDHTHHSFFDLPRRAGNGILGFLNRLMEVRTRQEEMNFYNSLSDEALAKRGLRREDIVLHVFRDSLY